MKALFRAEVEEVSSQARICTERISNLRRCHHDLKHPPQLNHSHMRYIKTIGNQEDEIFNPPDSFWGSDLRQSPANPSLDGISKQQCNAHNGREDLATISHAATTLRYMFSAYPASIKRGRACHKCQWTRSVILERMRQTDIDVSFFWSRNIHYGGMQGPWRED